MGTAAEVLSARAFRTRLYEAIGHLIKPLKAKSWDDVCKCLAAIVEVVENAETTAAYQGQQWVESYLENHSLWMGDWQEAAYQREPFQKNGLLYIHAGDLRKHLRILEGEPGITKTELCECLRMAGFTSKPMTVRHKDKRFCRSYWIRKSAAK